MKTGMNLLLWTAAAGKEHFSLLERIRDWGFDGVELPIFDVAGSPWAALGAELDRLGLGRTAVTVLPEGTDLVSESKAEHEAAIAHLKACVDSCVELGAGILCGPLYCPVGKLVGRGPTLEERERCAEGLREVGEYADRKKVRIMIEPLNRFETYVINTQEDAARMVDAVSLDNVGQLFDTFHANIEEKDFAEAVAAGGGRIGHVHVSSNDRSTPGEDHIPWKETFSALKRTGYNGWLMIESFGSWLPELAGATCIWRKMAPSEEHVAQEGLKLIRETWQG